MKPLGIGVPHLGRDVTARLEHVFIHHPLRRILAFTRRTIDDVINDPMARNEVRCFYKLQRSIERHSEIRDLERQWNPLRR